MHTGASGREAGDVGAGDALPPLDGDHAVLDAFRVGLVVTDAAGRFRFVNREASAMLETTPEALLGKKLRQLKRSVITEDGARAPRSRFALARTLRDRKPHGPSRFGVVQRDGRVFWLESKSSPIYRDGRFVGAAVTLEDINAEVTSERARASHALFLERLLELTRTALATGPDGRFYQLITDTAVAVIPGAQAASLLMREHDRFHFRAATHHDMEALAGIYLTRDELGADLDDPGVQILRGFDNSVVAPDRRARLEAFGSARPIAVSLAVPVVIDRQPVAFFHVDNFDDPDAFAPAAIEMAQVLGNQIGSLWQRFRLEGDLQRNEQRLAHLAQHDPLTGLPNRLLLEERLERELRAAHRDGGGLALVLLDLDDFKDVNDVHGHDLGDDLLRVAARRMASALRPGDTLARWGGDEFVLLLPGVSRPQQATALASAALAALAAPLQLRDVELRVAASAGIDVSDGRATATEVMKHADIAMYHAKRAGKNTLAVFSDEMDASLRRRQQLHEDLLAALERDEFVLHYQPRVDLSGRGVTAVEALARWKHPERGLLPPSEFIPFAEETGLIVPLGARILELAVAQARRWRDAGREVRVAVNLSASQLSAPELIEHVGGLLAAHRLPGGALELEVTESTAMHDLAESRARLSALQALGVRLALDDFGTAYAHLVALAELPFDTVKIDGSFVTALRTPGSSERRARAIIEAVVSLGRHLGLRVVAEGVELESQCAFLDELGCHEAQGYLFARPVTAERLQLPRLRFPPG